MRLFKSADSPTNLCILAAAETHDRGGNQSRNPHQPRGIVKSYEQ
ncbi:unnamed protein product [Brassica rapa subsp. narinosa]